MNHRTRLQLLATTLATSLTALALLAGTAAGHSGGTDQYGCHAGSEPYHCHNEGNDGGNTGGGDAQPPAKKATSCKLTVRKARNNTARVFSGRVGVANTRSLVKIYKRTGGKWKLVVKLRTKKTGWFKKTRNRMTGPSFQMRYAGNSKRKGCRKNARV